MAFAYLLKHVGVCLSSNLRHFIHCFSENSFSPALSQFWNFYKLETFVIVPQVQEALFTYFFFEPFSLYKFYLSSSSLTLSSVITLLFTPHNEFLNVIVFFSSVIFSWFFCITSISLLRLFFFLHVFQDNLYLVVDIFLRWLFYNHFDMSVVFSHLSCVFPGSWCDRWFSVVS